jgi:hypothetical protein
LKFNERFGEKNLQVASRTFFVLHNDFLLGLFFDPEDGGDIFLRNVGWVSAVYTALYQRREGFS